MNVLINSLSNSIILSQTPMKKGVPFFKEIFFSYPLIRNENKVKALNELLGSDDAKLFASETSNTLIIPDDQVFNGVMFIPPFSKSKAKDAFETKFKVNFPGFAHFYLNYQEYERTNNGILMNYATTKKPYIDALVDAFKHHNIEIKNIEYFGNLVATHYENKNDYPIARLFIGQHESELLVIKGNAVVAKSIIELGEKELLDKSRYLISSYQIQNDEALKYASFHKTHFDTKDLLGDEIILSNPIHEAFIPSMPKESRILKGVSLENYHLKHTFIKFHAQIMDLLEFYSQTPYFLPIKEVNVFSSDEIFSYLLTANESNEIKYLKSNDEIASFVKNIIKNNDLFNYQLVTKVRRKIDWSKFFSMEIGKKKKA